jgi:hypothetical protein
MRCSTCGEPLNPGVVRCHTCGTSTPIGMALVRPAGVRRCPRCSYQGEGVSYFRRGSHIALLVALSIPYGFAGLVYWLARRKHLICPRCGLGWENASRVLTVTGSEPEQRILEEQSDHKLPRSGIKRRLLGAGMVIGGTLMLLAGILGGEAGLLVGGSLLGGGGSLGFYWGWHELQERRKAIMQRIQRKILRLAAAKGGTLTVTDVATDIDLGLPAAEKILMSMDDGFRVRSEISNEGVIYYEFPELLHRKEIGSGD